LSHGFTHIAISEKENPTSLRIYDFRDQSLLNELPWQSTWPYPCEFWFNRTPSDRLTILLSDDYSRVVTFDVITTLEVTPMLPRLPSSPLDVTTLPQILVANPMYTFVPNRDWVIYQRCLETDLDLNTATRCGYDQWVLYDPITRTALEILQNPDLSISQRVEFGNLGPDVFVVSPSGRYVAYPTLNGKMIYDLVNDRYLDTSAIGSLYSDYFVYSEVVWSPDETHFMFVIDDYASFEIGSLEFVVFNLNTNTIQRLNGRYSLSDYHWFPNSQSIAVLTDDDQLYRLGLDDTQTLIAENVERVFTYYPPPQ
jgi:hypothetical protein